ncbi:cation-translocating P-type ATPase, partial [Nocardioides mangrovi]
TSGHVREESMMSESQEVGARGLTAQQVAVLQARWGPNRVPRRPPRGVVRRVLEQLRDPMILLLLGAFAVVVALGDLSDASIIIAVVVLNTAIGVVQEVRAANALDALDQLAAPAATALRDGLVVVLPAADLVPGDLVRLDAGDVVPADVRLVTAAGVEVDESAMTGESVPVGRSAGNELLAGTVLTRGHAEAVVVRIGTASGLGAIAAAVLAAGVRPTPLQVRLGRLSAQLVWLTLGLATLVLLLGVARGEDPVTMVVLAVSLAVAAIPESLPAVVTVALALGAYRMARRHALVRRLPAVETLGSVTVLASDKTGTLTEGRMQVRELWTPEGPTGPSPSELLRDLVLCNDAELRTPVGAAPEIAGDPTEKALLVAATDRDPDALSAREAWERVEEEPFDSAAKRMVTLHAGPTGRLAICKGAPESVLPLIGEDLLAARVSDAAGRLAAAGHRVLAVADRAVPVAGPTCPPLSALLDDPRDWALRGLVALVDPPRASAREVVAACREAGIRVVMITGDHPETARAIARELAIVDGAPEVATGRDVARGWHRERVARIGVYARTRPEDKVDIVAAWQARGDVVAMTGDGVNDAPALRNADIGVAMGGRGTEVARQAADLVLADDDLRTVVVAVAEGRRIYANIRRFLRYGLSGGLAEVAVLMVAPWIGMPVPLTAGQILWINMITHGVPGVAFGGEPGDPADMARPSPSPERSVLGGLLAPIAVTAALIAAASLAVGTAAATTAVQQTSVFVCLGLAQLWLALALRAPRAGQGWRARGLEAAVTVAAVLLLAATAWAPLRDLLGTSALGTQRLVAIAVVAAAPAMAVLALDRWRRRRDRVQEGSSGTTATVV